MMLDVAMQKRVSPCPENGLDQRRKLPAAPRTAPNSNHMTIRALRLASQEERPCVFIMIATPT
jgi:hypothetical protein